ncbi:MAG: hypothetical protein ACQEP6_03465 [Patescibacteria group bacterium]
MKYGLSIQIKGFIVYKEEETIKIALPVFLMPKHLKKRGREKLLKKLKDDLGKQWIKEKRFFNCVLYDLCLDVVCYYEQEEFICSFCPFWRNRDISKDLSILRSMPNFESRKEVVQRGGFALSLEEFFLEKIEFDTKSINNYKNQTAVEI